MKNISFYEFAKMIEPDYKIPSYMKPFIKALLCKKGQSLIIYHKSYGRNYISTLLEKMKGADNG